MSNILRYVCIACLSVLMYGVGLCAATDTDALDHVVSVPDAQSVRKRLRDLGVENVSTIMPHLEKTVCQKNLTYREVCARVQRSTLRVSENAFSVGCELHGKYDRIIEALVGVSARGVCGDAVRK